MLLLALILPGEIVAGFFDLDGNQQWGVFLAVVFFTLAVYILVLPAKDIIKWDKIQHEFDKKKGYSTRPRVYNRKTNPRIVKDYRIGALITILVALLTLVITFWYELRALFPVP